MRTKRRIRVVSGQIGRRNHELKTLCVTGGRPEALIHVAATDPLGSRSDPDLVPRPVVSHDCASRVSPMPTIVTGLLRVGSANTAAGMNGVVPVEIVICDDSIPPTVSRLQRCMSPARSCIEITHDNSPPLESHSPNRWRINVCDPPFDGTRRKGPCGGNRKTRDIIVLDPAHWSIRVNASDIRSGRQCLNQWSVNCRDNHVGYPK